MYFVIRSDWEIGYDNIPVFYLCLSAPDHSDTRAGLHPDT